MSGHKKAVYEKKQKFLEGFAEADRELMATLFDLVHTNKYGMRRALRKVNR